MRGGRKNSVKGRSRGGALSQSKSTKEPSAKKAYGRASKCRKLAKGATISKEDGGAKSGVTMPSTASGKIDE